MEWKQTESTVKPSPVDATSSAGTVYLRRNISQIKRTDESGTVTEYWQYEEAPLTREEYGHYAAENLTASIDSIATAQATTDDVVAETLLNQMDIIATQAAQDATLAEILLNTIQ